MNDALIKHVERALLVAIRDGDCLLARQTAASGRYATLSLRKSEMFDGRRNFRLHRIVLQHRIGRTLAPHEQALHMCDRPPCINPDHLYVGSHGDNMRDKRFAGTQYRPRGMKSPRAKLTDAQVLRIRERYARGGVSYKALGGEYGLTAEGIFRVVNNITWRHLP